MAATPKLLLSIILLFLPRLLTFTRIAAGASVDGGEPIVQLSYGSFQGAISGDLTTFLGMPFAAPPIGSLRLSPPAPPLPFDGIRQATTYGSSCLQVVSNSSLQISEDCLFINVIKPTTITAGVKLPVVFWIYGGAFQIGDDPSTPGNTIVDRSIALNVPIIYVSANYRLGPLGFLGGNEIKSAGAGNLGIRDQRFAIQWIQTNIAAFGGDPTKVTIWGGSAGSISVGLQLLINDGNNNGLFRGAFMQSGYPVPLSDITSQQGLYDQFVANAGCTGSSDTLACLRSISSDQALAALTKSPQGLGYSTFRLPWIPSVDGQLIVRNPQTSIKQGLYAKAGVPLLAGEVDDEATLFCFSTLNITTNDEFLNYMQTNYYTKITSAQLISLGQAYPDDITQGSPFDTGLLNAVTPEFKRLAAIQGDLFFQSPRRYFLSAASKTQHVYAYLYKRGKVVPLVGSFHGSDVGEFAGTGLLPDYIGTDALVNFVNTLNPTTPSHPGTWLSGFSWPEYGSSTSAPPLFTFTDLPLATIISDTFRSDGINLLTELNLQEYASS